MTVNIGGRDYPVVKIGNQLWMAENLDWKYSGVLINPSVAETNSAAWYYGLDEATYGIDGTYKCGLLYNFNAANVINNNCPTGWRVPTKEDFETLIETSVNAGALKAIDGSIYSGFPSSLWGGVNTSHFNATPCGRLDPDAAPYKFIYFNEIGCWWSISSYDYRDAYFLRLANNSDLATVGSYNKKLAFPIRLVKDA